MVKGEVKYEDDVIAEALENIQSAERASGIEPVALEDPNQGDPNEELPGYFADGNEGGLGYGPDASITKVQGTMYTEGEAYCTTMAVKRSCVLCTHKKKSLLTDYFHLKIVKLCLTLRCLRALIFQSAKNVLKELALQGVQIGYSAQKMENLFVF
jgi:hypothetical protein